MPRSVLLTRLVTSPALITRSDGGSTWRHIVSLDDELSSSAVRIHYPCMMQLGEEPRIMVAYSRFYLSRKMGLSSPDQVGRCFAPQLKQKQLSRLP